MNSQSGSALIGVLSLGLAMTVAAAGYMMIASNTGRSIADEEERAQLHYDAESALRLGLRWAKRYPPNNECSDLPSELFLTKGLEGNWIAFGDSQVMIEVKPGDPSRGRRTIQATAKRESISESVIVSIDILLCGTPTTSTATVGPIPNSNVSLDLFTESVTFGI